MRPLKPRIARMSRRYSALPFPVTAVDCAHRELEIAAVIYLDHNATTPLRPEVFEAMRPFLTERWGNPSSSYAFGSQLKSVIEEARGYVAALLGASAREVIFTGSATESNNTALNAALSANPAKRHIITSAVEHSAVLNHTSRRRV